MSCAYCPLPIRDSDVYWELKCGKHLAHGNHGTTRCRICAGGGGGGGGTPVKEQANISAPVSATVPLSSAQPSAIPDPARDARARRLANNAARRTEPLKPYEPSVGWVESMIKVAGRVAEASIPDDESSDPEVLLDAGVPLKTLVQKHGFDITELINDHGITIAHFFRNGYTIGEMCEAFGSRMNPAEGMSVLYYLGMTDQFLTDMPSQCQLPVMRAKLGLTVDGLIKHLDYKFVPGRWTLPQMLEVGLTMPVVMKQGMRTKEEWTQLRETARNTSDLLQFGVTPLLEAQLVQPMAPVPSPALAPVQSGPAYSTRGAAAQSMTPVQSGPASGHIYGPIIPKQWPPPGISVPVSTVVPATKVSTYSWGSRMPADVMPGPAAVPMSVQQPSAPRVDTTPKLVNRPALVILPQHQANQTVKYALKG